MVRWSDNDATRSRDLWGGNQAQGYPTVYLSNYIGHGPEMSVNVAEYCGLIMVFEWLKANQIDEALIHGDSEMVILQMRGIQKARAALMFRTI